MSAKTDFGKLPATKLGWGFRKCGGKEKAHSKVLDQEVVICSVAVDRIENTTGGMTLSGLTGGDKTMARRKKKCKFGVVKSGKRKGLCRKQRVRRKR